MIELYRTVDCQAAIEIEASLKEMVIRHKVITVEADQWPDGLPTATPLPALRDGREIFTGSAIAPHLRELERVMAEWQKFQSDSCYIGDDGQTC